MPSVAGIAQQATALQSNQVQTQIGTAIAAKQLDAVKQQGDAALELLQKAADISKRIDVRG